MDLLKTVVFKRAAILCILLVLRSQETTAGFATLSNNVYSNIVVAISKDLSTSTNLVSSTDTLKDLFRSASSALFNATGNRVYFGDITVIGPSGTINNAQLRKPRATDNQWQPPFPTFDSADIRIDIPNVAYGDYPYTQQSRGCGEPGDFIHLTQGFVNGISSTVYDSAQKGKMLANEWIKYRYGVFDENGYSYNEIYPQMYYGRNGDKLYNTCNNSPVTWDDNNNICTGTSSIQGLSESCSLIPDTTATANSLVNTSMMSAPSISLATKYCSNSSDHNSDAPNKQNYLCKGTSIMEVVLSHPDFANNANSPISSSSYKDLQVATTIETNKNIGLMIVLDPMAYAQTLYTVIPALEKFMAADLPINSYFGLTENIVDTDATPAVIVAYARVQNNVTKDNIIGKQIAQIDSNNATGLTRNTLSNTITTVVNEMTTKTPAIGYSKAILLFSDILSQTELSDACSRANSSGTQLHLVTYNTTIFKYFIDCPGQVYLIQAETLTIGSDDLKNCYSDLQKRVQLENVLTNIASTILPDYFEPPTVYLEQMYLESTSNGSFFVDQPVVSGDVYFFVETCLNGIYGTIDDQQPKLLKPTLGSSQTAIQYAKEIDAFVDYQSINSGQMYWNFTATNLNPQPVPYIVYAVGQPFSQSWSTIIPTAQVIKTEGWILAETQENTWSKVCIFASVKKGTTPIFNAKVAARILQVGTSTNFTVVLRDDGSGNPDISEQDGIYSAYFTQFSPGQQYSVTITINDNDGDANYPTSPYPSLTPNNNDMGIVNTGQFQRIIEAGSFTASGQQSSIPPGSITNFHVKSISDESVTVSWTAPGLYLDYGQASKYVFNCDTNRDKLAGLTKLSDMAIASNVPQTNPPKSPGSTETATFTGSYDQAVHYCAVQAFDRTGTKYGAKSNIISYYITSDFGLTTEAIVGIVVGVILGIILLIALIVLLWYCFAR